MSIFQNFNHRKYLNSKDIRTKEKGENIGPGWLGIYECIYCGKPNYHFGIHNKHKHVNCWVCSTSKPLPSFIMKLEKCSYEEAIKIIIKFSDGKEIDFSDYDRKRSNQVIMPSGIEPVFRPAFRKYIQSRGFSDPDYIINKYNLLCTSPFSEIPSRLIFPFYYKEDMVTFIHRKINKKGYRNWMIEKSILDVKSTVYNVDSVKKDGNIVIVEGVFDTIKGGDGFVGTSGLEYSSEQIKMIISKHPKNIFIIFDPEPYAQKVAKRLMADLSLFCNNIENIYLSDDEDVGGMSEEDVIYLRKELKM